MRHTTLLASACFLVGSLVLLAGSAMLAPKPAVIAAVDLEKVYDGLEEQKAADAALEAMAASMNADTEARRTALDKLSEELASFKPSSPSYVDQENKIELEMLRYNALIDFNRNKLEARRAEFIRNIYTNIKMELRAIAEEQKLDIVFLDDSIPELDPSDAQRTMQQISARRMLYTNRDLDITDLLITRMNGTWTSKGGGSNAGG